jgi:hypothetical protein
MKRRSIRLCIACVLALALCMLGCAGRCAPTDDANEIAPATAPPTQESGESEPITVTEDEITLSGSDGNTDPLPTVPVTDEPSATAAPTETPATPAPTNVLFDPLEIGNDPTPSPSGSSRTTPKPTARTTPKPTATPAASQTPANDPQPSQGNGDIELPELP